MACTRTWVLAALLAGSATAQTNQVIPGNHAGMEGSGSTNVPFGRSTPMRVQMAYAGSLFAGKGTLRAVAVRLDGGATARAKKVDLEVRVSTMPVGVTAIQHRFATNIGRDEVVAIGRKVVALPGATVGKRPNPFHATLPFDRGFSYDPARGPLLMEIRVHGQQPGAFPLDATFVCTSARAEIGPTGCGPKGRVLRTGLPTTQVMWGKPVSWQVTNARARATTFLFLGSRDTGNWLGKKLPIDLAAIGAPGCHLSIDVVAAPSARANSTGVATYRFHIPSIPALHTQWIRYQAAALDAAANPLGVSVARAAKVQICGWEPVSRVYAPGSAPETGLREIGLAPVLSIDLR